MNETSSSVWMSGPAGSGKTSVLSDYLGSKSNVSYIWIHLDDDDSEPSTFFHYFSLAVSTVAKHAKMPVLQPEYRQELATFARKYFRTLIENLSGKIVIILDNYESIGSSSEVNLINSIGILETRTLCRWFIASREAPPKEFVGLVANGQIQQIGWDDLRFTVKEYNQFAKRRLDKTRNSEWIEQYYVTNQGWIAGLILAIEALREDITVDALTWDSNLFQYFAVEVFQRLKPIHQTALLQLSCFPEFSNNDVKIMFSEHKELLELVESQASSCTFLFKIQAIKTLTTTNQGYRFHPLFLNFLRNEAKARLEPDEWRNMHLRAASRLQEDNRPEQAIAILIEVDDWMQATQLIHKYAPKLVEAGRHDLLRKWIEKRPSGLAAEIDSWLSYWLAKAWLPFDPRKAQPLFKEAYQKFEKTNSTDGLQQSWASGVESVLYGWSSFSDFDYWLELYDNKVSGLARTSFTVDIYITCVLHSALILRRPDDQQLPQLDQKLRRVLIMSKLVDPTNYVLLACTVFFYDLLRGYQARAAQLLKSMVAAAKSKRAGPMAILGSYNMESLYAHFTGEGDVGQKKAEEGLELASKYGIRFWDAQLLAQGVFGAIGQQDIEDAERLLEKLYERIEPDRHNDNELYYDAMAQIALKRNHTEEAVTYIEKTVRHTELLGSQIVQVLHRVGAAEVYWEAGRKEQCEYQLDQAELINQQIKSTIYEARIYITRAYTKLGDLSPEFYGYLRNAFSLCRKHNYMGWAWWRPEVVAKLCAEALKADIETDFVKKLIAKRRLLPPPHTAWSSKWPWPVQVSTLGTFRIYLASEPLKIRGKTQQRPLELFEALIAAGGQNVPIDDLASTLWPEQDLEAGQQSVITTLHRPSSNYW